jgi:glutamate synthase (NADPH/NADH) large chain
MSGGVAYVWNLDRRRVNPELVDLEPVSTPDVLRSLMERHAVETGSPVAASLLARWEQAVAEFTAVVPRDYKRVVEAISAAEAAGRDIDEAVMSVLNGGAGGAAGAGAGGAAPVAAPVGVARA